MWTNLICQYITLFFIHLFIHEKNERSLSLNFLVYIWFTIGSLSEQFFKHISHKMFLVTVLIKVCSNWTNRSIWTNFSSRMSGLFLYIYSFVKIIVLLNERHNETLCKIYLTIMKNRSVWTNWQIDQKPHDNH